MRYDMESERVNFFSVNVCESDGNDLTPDCAAFRTRSISPEQHVSLEQTSEHLQKILDKASLPLWLEAVKSICLYAGMLLTAGLMGREGSFMQNCKDAPALSLTAAAGFAAWLAIKIYAKIRRRRTRKMYPAEYANEQFKSVESASKTALGIPEGAANIDVLIEGYTLKSGKRRRKSAAMCPYINLPMSVFTDGGALCIANLTDRWDIPLSSLGRAELVNKRPNLPYWNKDEPYTDEKYKPYKITTNNFGHCFARYYRIDIDDERGRYFLLVPEYDGETLKELTGTCPKK